MTKSATDKNGWINAKQCPPQTNFRIMLSTGTGAQYIGHWVKNPETEHEAFCIADLGEGEMAIVAADHITHWRPLLPKPAALVKDDTQ